MLLFQMNTLVQFHIASKCTKLSFYQMRQKPVHAKDLVLILFVCFVALHPKSTAMVIAGRSVHLTTLFPGQA